MSENLNDVPLKCFWLDSRASKTHKSFVPQQPGTQQKRAYHSKRSGFIEHPLSVLACANAGRESGDIALASHECMSD